MKDKERCVSETEHPLFEKKKVVGDLSKGQ